MNFSYITTVNKFLTFLAQEGREGLVKFSFLAKGEWGGVSMQGIIECSPSKPNFGFFKPNYCHNSHFCIGKLGLTGFSFWYKGRVVVGTNWFPLRIELASPNLTHWSF